MDECSTKRMKIDEQESNSGGAEGVTQFTTVSLSVGDSSSSSFSSSSPPASSSVEQAPSSSSSSTVTALPSRLNKITLVAMPNSTQSPIKANTTVNVSSPAKISFIDSLTKKSTPNSPAITASTTTATTTSGSGSNTAPTATQVTTNTKRILTITSSNGTSISPSVFTSSLNGSEKIQYVKIVNSNQGPSTTIMPPATTTTSSTNSTTSSIVPNNSIKITSVCSSSSSTQEGITNVRPLSTAATVKTIPKTIIQSKPTLSSIAAINNGNSKSTETFQPQSGGTINSIQPDDTNSVSSSQAFQSPLKNTTTTFQLINSFSNSGLQLSPQQTGSQGTSVHQRINISNSPSGRSITTVTAPPLVQKMQTLSGTPTTTTTTTANYKVLSQQLPQQPSTSTTTQSIVIKPSSIGTTAVTTNPATGNRIVITKTVANAAVSSEKHISSLAKVGDVIRSGGTPTTQISLTPIANSANLNAIGKIKTSAFLSELEKHTLAINSQQQAKPPNRTNPTLVSSLNNVLSSVSESCSNSSSSQQSSAQVQTYSLNAVNSNASSSNSSNARKPCNCNKSMCLKLYCDCFAMGAFCHDCNCVNCFNTLEHEDERNKAIKLVLDRNPQAFQSKIGKFTVNVALNKMLPTVSSASGLNGLLDDSSSSLGLKRAAIDELDEIQSRHVKGCNCKKSNCLKRYCECYLAKIQCSTLCKCVGCKNCDDATRSLLELANAADLRNKQSSQHSVQHHSRLNQHQQPNKRIALNSTGQQQPFGFLNLSNHSNSRFNLLNGIEYVSLKDLERQLSIYRSYGSVLDDSIEASCLRLLNRATSELAALNQQETTENEREEIIEKSIIEEFGTCLTEIISSAEKRKLPYS